MKLGAALTLRANQAQKLADLRGRITANVTSQEGENPSEDPGELLNEFAAVSQEHGALIERINKTNLQTPYEDGTLLRELQRREHKRRVKNMLEQTATTTTGAFSLRYMRSELRMVAHVNVQDLHTQIDILTEEIRLIDANIQAINWQTDLVE